MSSLGAGGYPGVARAAGRADQAQGRGRGERQEPAAGPGRPGASRLVTLQYSNVQYSTVQSAWDLLILRRLCCIPIIVFKLNAALLQYIYISKIIIGPVMIVYLLWC